MYCKICGKEMAENAKFCSYCGSENNVSNPTYVDATVVNEVVENSKNVSNEKPKKKKTNILISLLVMIVAWFVGKNVIAPALLSTYNDNASQTETTNKFEFETIGDNVVSVLNPEYSSIFADNHIADLDTTFRGLKSNVYAQQFDTGMVEKLELAYEDDIVKEFVSTLYYPISDYTEYEIENLESELKKHFSSLERLSFCEVTYSKMNSFYSATITTKNLDKKESVDALSSTGLIGITSSSTLISMEFTEAELLRTGYVKKYVEA